MLPFFKFISMLEFVRLTFAMKTEKLKADSLLEARNTFPFVNSVYLFYFIFSDACLKPEQQF